MLAKEDDRALLIMSSCFGARSFDLDSNHWKGNPIISSRYSLNNEFIGGGFYPTLEKHALDTTIKTRAPYDSANFDTTTDKVFLLSSADVFGTQGFQGVGTTIPALPDDYTYNGQMLPAPGGSWAINIHGMWWLRSLLSGDNSGACVTYSGTLSGSEPSWEPFYVRPALWISI